MLEVKQNKKWRASVRYGGSGGGRETGTLWTISSMYVVFVSFVHMEQT